MKEQKLFLIIILWVFMFIIMNKTNNLTCIILFYLFEKEQYVANSLKDKFIYDDG